MTKKIKFPQITCIHYEDMIAAAKGGYSYKLVNAELNLCFKCEKKLREQIIKQKEIEDSLMIR